MDSYYEMNGNSEPDEDFFIWRAETGGTWPQYLQAIADGTLSARTEERSAA